MPRVSPVLDGRSRPSASRAIASRPDIDGSARGVAAAAASDFAAGKVGVFDDLLDGRRLPMNPVLDLLRRLQQGGRAGGRNMAGTHMYRFLGSVNGAWNV
ncbi:hypothetical protein MoryE10_34550 [Methylogaea oryzae]|uniref:Uncharacterized protein n=1 Tax=Methylogaea oryzae TaxID=1295382 RepID=A0A8D4VT76_9GAMM|nr:hypothetical protein MoryE10_34550 [Methylogaea oryzae]